MSSFDLGDAARYRYFADPVAFAVEVLGITAWSRMIDMMCALRDHDRVAVRAGQKVSKSATIASLALWWVSTRPRGRFIYTSSSQRQVRDVLYLEELVRLHREARVPLGGEIAPSSPETGIRWADGRSIVGFTAQESKPERFLGFSGPALFFAADEASGVPTRILETIDGNRAGGAKFLMTGNPTRGDGFFAEAFNGRRGKWKCLRISSEESPNVTGELGPRSRIPGLATSEYIAEKREEWGVDSPHYLVKILGEFAGENEHTFIRLAIVDAAALRWTSSPSAEDACEILHIGVDPARFGADSTCIVLRRGRWTSPPIVLEKKDTVEVANEVVRLARLHRRPNERPIVKVDASNNNGVADILKRQEGLEVVEVISQASSPDPQFARVRDVLWASLLDWLKRDGAIADDPKLAADLTAPTWQFVSGDKVKLEDKRELRRRIGRSTDRADALALAVYDGGMVTRPHDELIYSPEFDNMPRAGDSDWGLGTGGIG